MFQLLHSIQPEISPSLLLLSTAHDIWTSEKQTNSRGGNDAQIYELQKTVHKAKHKGMTVYAYYSEFQTLWHELDDYQDFVQLTTKFKKLVDKKEYIIFWLD